VDETTPCAQSVDCPICLESICTDDRCVVLVKCCNNHFHSNCYLRWMDTKRECPLCRTRMAICSVPVKTEVDASVVHIHSETVGRRSRMMQTKRACVLVIVSFASVVFYHLTS